LRRALEEASRGEAKSKSGAKEERRLTPGELSRGVDQLLEILLTQRVGEMLDLIGSRIDVFRERRVVLFAHLSAGVMESHRYSI